MAAPWSHLDQQPAPLLWRLHGPEHLCSSCTSNARHLKRPGCFLRAPQELLGASAALDITVRGLRSGGGVRAEVRGWPAAVYVLCRPAPPPSLVRPLVHCVDREPALEWITQRGCLRSASDVSMRSGGAAIVWGRLSTRVKAEPPCRRRRHLPWPALGGPTLPADPAFDAGRHGGHAPRGTTAGRSHVLAGRPGRPGPGRPGAAASGRWRAAPPACWWRGCRRWRCPGSWPSSCCSAPSPRTSQRRSPSG